MLALFDRNGFTKMERIPNDDPPRHYALLVAPPTVFAATSLDPLATVDIEKWTFELYEVNWVDGERIAYYRYCS